jgi:5'-3' exonuclease
MLNETLDIISENFPFKVVKVNRAEGDDIIAVLAKNYKEKHLIVSEDKDMKQLLKYSYVSFFRPIQKEYIIMSENELKKWKREHILGGDKSDNIPTIKEGTIFSPNFIKYLKENEIFETDVYSFNKLSISKKLYSEYKGVDKYGKSDIFKGADFGVVSIEKFAKDFWKNIVQNKMWIINYRRNQHLVLFDYMPEWIETETLKCFSELSCNYNPQKIMEYFNDNRLRTLSNNLQDFFISNNQTTISNNSSFDDWF